MVDLEAFRDGGEQPLGGAGLPAALVDDDWAVLVGGLLDVAADRRCRDGPDDVAAADVLEWCDERGIEQDLVRFHVWVAQGEYPDLSVGGAYAEACDGQYVAVPGWFGERPDDVRRGQQYTVGSVQHLEADGSDGGWPPVGARVVRVDARAWADGDAECCQG